MKLRIQDNSVRYRITIQELEHLVTSGTLVRETRVPDGSGGSTRFVYEVRREENEESNLLITPYSICLSLGRKDFDTLIDPTTEGAYIQKEWVEEGQPYRFLVFIEKDRPGSSCIKPEAWIYEQNPGGTPSTVPQDFQGRDGLY